MPIVKVFLENDLSSLNSAATKMRNERIESLLKFSKEKCLEHGIISKSYSSSIDPRFSNANSWKLFKKISTSLTNQLVRKIPFLEFREIETAAEVPTPNEFSVDISKHTVKVDINQLKAFAAERTEEDTIKEFYDLSASGLKRFMEFCGEFNFTKPLVRYARYINYKCVANKVPAHVHMRTYSRFLDPDSLTSGTKEATVEIFAVLDIELGSWEQPEGTLEVNAARGRGVAYGNALFRSFSRQRDSYSENPECSVFNLFMFFDDMKSVLKTLFRKSNFNVNAFAV